MIVQRRSPVEPDVLHALKAVGGLWPAETRGLPYARLLLDVLGLIGGIVGTIALAAAVPGTAEDRAPRWSSSWSSRLWCQFSGWSIWSYSCGRGGPNPPPRHPCTSSAEEGPPGGYRADGAAAASAEAATTAALSARAGR